MTIINVRKRPVVVQALQFKGEPNIQECIEFCPKAHPASPKSTMTLIIETLEGHMVCNLNDWIIKGVQGEFYPVKPDIFMRTYEPA